MAVPQWRVQLHHTGPKTFTHIVDAMEVAAYLGLPNLNALVQLCRNTFSAYAFADNDDTIYVSGRHDIAVLWMSRSTAQP